jgi:hypothetical protein
VSRPAGVLPYACGSLSRRVALPSPAAHSNTPPPMQIYDSLDLIAVSSSIWLIFGTNVMDARQFVNVVECFWFCPYFCTNFVELRSTLRALRNVYTVKKIVSGN